MRKYSVDVGLMKGDGSIPEAFIVEEDGTLVLKVSNSINIKASKFYSLMGKIADVCNEELK